MRLLAVIAATLILALLLWLVLTPDPGNITPREIPNAEADREPAERTDERETEQTATARDESPGDTEATLAGMRETRTCYESRDCSVGDQADPRAEYFAAGNRVAEGMRSLTTAHKAGELSDEGLSQAALEFLEMESGRVRAAAIEALGRVPAEPAHLDALFDVLEQHHDEKLFELALAEFERHAQAGRHQEVDAFLQENLRRGARFPARVIAANLGPFLTGDNRDAWAQLLQDLPEDSERAARLKKALEEAPDPDTP